MPGIHSQKCQGNVRNVRSLCSLIRKATLTLMHNLISNFYALKNRREIEMIVFILTSSIDAFCFKARTHEFGRRKDEDGDYGDDYYSYDSYSAAAGFTGYSGVAYDEDDEETEESEEEKGDDSEGDDGTNEIENETEKLNLES